MTLSSERMYFFINLRDKHVSLTCRKSLIWQGGSSSRLSVPAHGFLPSAPNAHATGPALHPNNRYHDNATLQPLPLGDPRPHPPPDYTPASRAAPPPAAGPPGAGSAGAAPPAEGSPPRLAKRPGRHGNARGERLRVPPPPPGLCPRRAGAAAGGGAEPARDSPRCRAPGRSAPPLPCPPTPSGHASLPQPPRPSQMRMRSAAQGGEGGALPRTALPEPGGGAGIRARLFPRLSPSGSLHNAASPGSARAGRGPLAQPPGRGRWFRERCPQDRAAEEPLAGTASKVQFFPLTKGFSVR